MRLVLQISFQIANKWKQEVESRTRPVSTDAVNGFDQFLMTKKTYLLGKDAGGDRSTDDFTVSCFLRIGRGILSLTNRLGPVYNTDD